MIEKISQIESSVFKLGLILVTIISIFFVWQFTTEFYDTPKFLALIIFLILMLILSTLKYITEGKVVLTITPLDLPLLVILVVAAVSTYTSSSPYISLLGNASRIHGSLVALVVYVLFYFLLVNNLKRIKDFKPVLMTVAVSSILLSIQSLISYFNVKFLPISWTQVQNFTPTGSSFTTASILVLTTPFLLTSLIRSNNTVLKISYSLILTLFGLTILLIGSWPVQVAAIITVLLTIYLNRRYLRSINLSYLDSQALVLSLVIPIVIITLVGILSFVKMPQAAGKLANNILYQQAQSFPREIQLPFATSWSVSVSAFRDSPFWGTGPSSYLFNFTNYKPVSFNYTNVWNIRFDQAFNEYFSFLASFGGIGLVALLGLTAIFMSTAFASLSQNQTEDQNQASEIKTGLVVSGITIFILLALHVSTLTIFVIGILILASFYVANPQYTKTIHIRLGAIRSLNPQEGLSFDILPIILLLIMLVLAGGGYYYIGKYAWADYHHRNALNAVAANNVVVTYNELVSAEQLNPYSDLYRTDLANTNFAIANAIASAKGPTQSSPSGSLTDQDKQNIQQLLSQAINEGRNATSLSPRSANNWEVLGNVYRQISGVAQNALQFSLDAYGRAIAQDPANPNLRLTVGGIYYSIKNYDMAIRFFTDAVNLKTDFANGYFNLSVALRDKGDLANAQSTAETLVSLVDPNSADYKTASEYLKDLKDRIATGSAQQSQITPPASEQTSTLQRKNLPKVIDLPQPETIASPAAVKKQ